MNASEKTPDDKDRESALSAIRNDPERRRYAASVAQFAVERLNNLYGTRFGDALVKQFTDYVLEQATDIDADVLKKHAVNLGAWKLTDPDAWGKRKPWISAPKGHRLLKALMGIVREADKAAEKSR